MKGSEPDLNAVAKMILNDWQRGRIPFFTPPPGHNTMEFAIQKSIENKETEKYLEEEAKELEEELKKVGRIEKDEEKEKDIKKVSQNFKNINMTLQFDEEDDAPLETTEDENEVEIVESDGEEQVSSDEDPKKEEEMEQEDEEEDTKSYEGEDQLSSDEDIMSAEEEEKIQPQKLKCKERRRLERAAKPKKVGFHFSEVVNIKNKNRDSRPPCNLNNKRRKKNQK